MHEPGIILEALESRLEQMDGASLAGLNSINERGDEVIGAPTV